MELCEAIRKTASLMSVTGYEDYEAETLRGLLGEWFDEYRIDPLKNQVFIRRCGRENAPKILIDTHFDEIGMIVTDIKDGGFLTVTNIGGLDTRILQAADVMIYGRKTVRGVVASTPPHLAKPEDKGNLRRVDELLIDTGYTRKEIEEIVCIGTPVGFVPRYTRLGEKELAGKGFDNKACVACAAAGLSKVSRDKQAGDVYFLLSAHEETDRLGGVVVGGERIMPDYAMVMDVNLGRTPDTKPEETVELGKGVSVTLSAVTDRHLTGMVLKLAEREKIPTQKIVSAESTGTNAASLGLVRGGVPTVDVGLPLKSMHTYNEVLNTDDAEALTRLVAAFVCDREIAEVFGDENN